MALLDYECAATSCFCSRSKSLLFVVTGNCLVASAKVIFASSRAVEIKVDVDEQTLDTNQVMLRKRAAESIITCLSLDESYQSREMAPIKVS